MLRYLDARLDYGVSRVDNYILVYYSVDPHDPDKDGILFEYDAHDGRLYMNKDFLENFYSFFPFDENNLKEVTKVWFESKFHVQVKFIEVSF